jgi:hypothetical protein
MTKVEGYYLYRFEYADGSAFEIYLDGRIFITFPDGRREEKTGKIDNRIPQAIRLARNIGAAKVDLDAILNEKGTRIHGSIR